LTEVRSALIGR